MSLLILMQCQVLLLYKRVQTAESLHIDMAVQVLIVAYRD